jgi:predicted transposase YbfD/YdcC
VIITSGNDYCVQVKANQATLLEKLQQSATQQAPIDQADSREKNRGRIEHRRVKLFAAPQHCQQDYPGLVAFAQLRRWGYRNHQAYDATHYYILSRAGLTAQQVGAIIRGHWSIENRLHYVKDVSMGEDHNGVAHPQAAKNLSLLKNVVLNVVRLKGFTSLKIANNAYAHNIKELYNCLL